MVELTGDLARMGTPSAENGLDGRQELPTRLLETVPARVVINGVAVG